MIITQVLVPTSNTILAQLYSKKRMTSRHSIIVRFLLTVITTSLLGVSALAQKRDLLQVIFQDKSNFDITLSFDHKKPLRYFVLNKTDRWNTNRFHLDEDISSEKAITKLEQDEHSPYNHTYLFKDTLLNKLFKQAEKNYLFNRAKAKQPVIINNRSTLFKPVSSIKSVPNGFFFSVTEPIFSEDQQYAFIDMVCYLKSKETKVLNDTYFGTTILIYQYIKGKGWKRFYKRDHLIL